MLLKKPGRLDDIPSSYRPICLLSETGKLLERIVASRIHRHLREPDRDLHEAQYGFRVGYSVDAILYFRQITEEVVARGGVAVAVSIDIANAFNSVPWQAILDAMERREFPAYVRAIISDFLHDRWMSSVGKDGQLHRRRMVCGVPQGSVLGPLLWNIAYDEVLRQELPPGCRLVCYADDTLLIAKGRSAAVAINFAMLGTEVLVRAIRRVGLRVAPEKTEVVAFMAKHTDQLPEGIQLAGAQVPLRRHMKYLGLLVNRGWTFRAHFQDIIERGEKVVASLGRLMPNLRGPGERRRRFYAMVVRSIVLYGAPVWANDLLRQRWARVAFRRLKRTLSSHQVCAYRTVSGVVASMLAGTPPLELHAQYLRRTFIEMRKQPDTPFYLKECRPSDVEGHYLSVEGKGT